MGLKSIKMQICFFHLFKCGGTTFNWILQNNFPGEVLYAEKPDRCRGRLKASSVQEHLRQDDVSKYKVLSTHLAEPACAELAMFPCSMVRIPMNRNLSACNFQIHHGSTDQSVPYASYLERHHDFQVRVLDERIASIPNMEERLKDFERRCELAQAQEERTPFMGYGKSPADLTYLEPSTVPGLRPGFG